AKVPLPNRGRCTQRYRGVEQDCVVGDWCLRPLDEGFQLDQGGIIFRQGTNDGGGELEFVPFTSYEVGQTRTLVVGGFTLLGAVVHGCYLLGVDVRIVGVVAPLMFDED